MIAAACQVGIARHPAEILPDLEAAVMHLANQDRQDGVMRARVDAGFGGAVVGKKCRDGQRFRPRLLVEKPRQHPDRRMACRLMRGAEAPRLRTIRAAAEIGTCRDQPFGCGADGGQFAFGQVAGQDGAGRGAEMSILAPQVRIGLKEQVLRLADEVIQDEIRPRGADFLDHPANVGRSDGQVAFAQNLAARLGDDLAGKAVHLPAPDIVRPGQITALAVLAEGPAQKRQ